MKNIFKVLFCAALIAGPMHGCKKDDPCESVVCENGGTCNDGTCTCAAGYEGTTCKTEMRDKFEGTYNTSESCDQGNFTYDITISESSVAVTKVLIANFYGVGVTVSADVNGTSLSIPNQTMNVQGYSVTFSGTGQITGNILTLSYTASFDGSADSCTATCTKQ